MDKHNFKLEILKQEIELLDQRVRHFDDLRHRTKQMTATLWVAAVGAALTIPHSPSKPLLSLSAFIPLPFWYFDAQYRAYQRGFWHRWWAIRLFIRDGKFEIPPDERNGATDQQRYEGWDYWLRAFSSFIRVSISAIHQFIVNSSTGIRRFIRTGSYKPPADKASSEDKTPKWSLDDLFSDGAQCTFPVPDYYGNKTFEKDTLEASTSWIRSMFTLKLILFYPGLAVASGILLYFFRH